MLYKHLLSLGIEMIDPQRDRFGAEAEGIIEDIRVKIVDGIYKSRQTVQVSDEVGRLTELINDRLRMNVKLKVVRDIPAAVIPFFVNPSNVLMNKKLHGIGVPEQQKMMKGRSGERGTVDLKKAQLGGFFRDVEVFIFMDFVGLFTIMNGTTKEVTAFLFHELGHAFYAFEYADRLSTTNQVMAAAAGAMTGNDPKAKELLYIELSNVNKKVTKEDVNKLVADNRIIAGKKLYDILQTYVDSQMSNASYDKIAFEQMADNFATRFGYGREIVTGMQKFHAAYGNTDYVFTFLQYTLSAYVALGAAIVATGSFIIGGFYMLFFGYFLGRVSGDSARVSTYDDLKIRYKRIRNDMIAALKDRELDKDIKQSLIEQVQYVDGVIEKTPISRTILDQIANFIFQSDRDMKRAMRDQQQLEDLAHNDLFLKSTQLTV